jgi:hypothetical protein
MEFSTEVLWGAPEWAAPAIAIGLFLFGLILWSYLSPDTSGPIRLAAGTLKLLAVALLAICLLEPMRSGTRPRPQANVLPILVDNSQSMQLKASSEDQSRHQQVAALLSEDASWRVRIAQAFDVRSYAFDARLESVDDFTGLEADGYVSSMAGSLQSLGERFADRPVAGAILFSDGNLTDAPSAGFDWSTLGFPIYPVLPKADGEIRDLRIADVSIRQTDFESAPMTVNVSFDAIGMSDQEVFVQLRDIATGKIVEEKSARLDELGETQQMRFRFRPEKAGVSF